MMTAFEIGERIGRILIYFLAFYLGVRLGWNLFGKKLFNKFKKHKPIHL